MDIPRNISHRKKIIIIVVVCAFLILVFTAIKISSLIKPETHNVFDQLYYEVKTVKRGGDSVLISGTESAYADYDFGEFENIQIPDLDMCLDIDNDTLHILFSNRSGSERWNISDTILYRYDLKEKRLYGERPLDYLVDNFLNYYFEWCGDAGIASPYLPNDLGEYSFEYLEFVHW